MLVKPCLEKNEEFNFNYPNPRGGLFSASDVTAPLKLRPYGAIQICLLLLLLLLQPVTKTQTIAS